MATGARRRGRGSSHEAAKAESEKVGGSATAGDASGRASSRSNTETTRSGADAERRPKLTRAEAGRLGGLKTRELYGSKHYKDIGKQGGAKGGAVTKQKYGSEHYRRIGSLRGKRASGAGGQSPSST